LTSDSSQGGPFGRAAQIYRAAGWTGTLPIGKAPGRKYPPPNGFTGHAAPYPDGGDVGIWLSGPEAFYNIGLRMPRGVIGLDIDAGYVKDGEPKRGDETLAQLEAAYGPLPPTWASSARPAPSGIRFYRVPELLDGREINWPGEAGKFIEIIQAGHRYAVVWPSTNPEAAGAEYRWTWSEGGRLDSRVDAPPSLGELPELPEAWVRGLALSYDRAEKAELASPAMHSWWSALRTDAPCPSVVRVRDRAMRDIAETEGSRHETARDAVASIVRMGAEGHRGAADAALAVGATFCGAIGETRVASGEWDRLLSGAVKLAAGVHAQPRQSCEHDAATPMPAHMVPEGFTSPAAIEAAPPASAVPAGDLTLPDEFWQARESLRRIRQAAHSRVRSGDVVFYGTLARLAAMAPHTLRADTGVGTPASLNLFAAIVGPSGGGKSSGLSVSRDLVKANGYLEEFPLGSGEGVAEAYMGEAMEGTGQMAKDGSEKQAKVRKMVRHNALFHTDEGQSLTKLIERAGSTVGETLRSAWSGETIGQKNGRADTTRTVPARSYAAGLMIGFQPSTALPMLADFEAGTPQRFLWCWAVDDAIPPRSARVLWPGELASPFPPDVPTDLPPPGVVVSAPPPKMIGESIHFAEAILDELYDIEHAKNTGTLPAGHWLLRPASNELDPMRSQHPVLKVKIASLLCLLDGRRTVDLDDWRLAQIVLDTSDRVREHLEAVAKGKAHAAWEAARAAEHDMESLRSHARQAFAEATERTAGQRLAARVGVWVHEAGEGLTAGALRKRAPSRDRPLIAEAVEAAVAAGWVVYGGPDGKVHPGPSRPAV
jgi:hypothetical protein